MFNPLSAEEFVVRYADEEGCDVYFADAPHGAGFFGGSLNRFAWAQILLVNYFHLEEADFLIHSGGGPIVRRMIEMLRRTGRRQVVRTVLFINPAGAMGHDSPGEAGKRFKQSARTEHRLRPRLQNWWALTNRWRRGGPEFYFGQSWVQTLLEGAAITKADLRPLFPLLDSLGVPYAVVCGSNDEAYPPNRVRAALVPEYVAEENFFVMEGGIQQAPYLLPYATVDFCRPILARLRARAM